MGNKLFSVILLFLVFTLSAGVTQESADPVSSDTPAENSITLSKPTIKSIKIASEEEDYIVITVISKENQYFRLQTMSAKNAARILDIIGKGGSIKLTYTPVPKKEFFIAQNLEVSSLSQITH